LWFVSAALPILVVESGAPLDHLAGKRVVVAVAVAVAVAVPTQRDSLMRPCNERAMIELSVAKSCTAVALGLNVLEYSLTE